MNEISKLNYDENIHASYAKGFARLTSKYFQINPLDNSIDVLVFVRWKYGNPIYKSINYLCDREAVIFSDNIQWVGNLSALIIMSLAQFKLIRHYTLNHLIKQDFTEIQLIKPKMK